MERTFSVQISECSRELSAKERLQIKDTTDAIKLDKATSVEPVIIDVDMYAIVSVHNEKSKENPDYNSYIIVDKNGTRYSTASPSFWNAFMNIWDELGGEEGWMLKVYKMPSKNREGKDFITCSVI